MKRESLYESIYVQLESMLNDQNHYVTNLANMTAYLKEKLKFVSWVGFYLFDGEKLFLGPFQGKVACERINLDQGVCGKAVSTGQTINVSDVHQFEGHIACDSQALSEIVVPIKLGQRIIGVLDVDSYHYHAFNSVDHHYLNAIVALLVSKTNFPATF